MLDAPARLPGCPPDLELEAVLASAAHPRRAHTEGCASCAARLAWMREAEAQFNRRVLPATRERVEAALARPPWWRRPPAWSALVAVACAAVAVLLEPRLVQPGDDYVGVKGGSPGAAALLKVYRGEAGGAHPLHGGDLVHPGDGLRFVVEAPGREVHLLSVDGSGRVSRLVPDGTTRVPDDGVVPGGAILDDAPGPERLFAVLAAPEVPLAEVEDAIRRAVRAHGVRGAEALPIPATYQTLLLEKEAR